jgi:hypothetical protein
MALLGCCLLLEVLLIGIAVRDSGRTVARVDRGLRALDMLSVADPVPTAANLETLQRERDGISLALEHLIAGLEETGSLGVEASELDQESQDFYFDLVSMIERFRARALGAGVRVEEKENFGFDEFVEAGHGPSEDAIAAALRQRKTIAFLVDQLLLAEPEAIIAVQREPGADGQKSPLRASRGSLTGDRYAIDSRLTTRVPGEVEAEAFRLVFTGKTDTLRRFLTRLAESGEPVAVRFVEVQPAENNAARSGPSRIRREGPGAPEGLFGDADNHVGNSIVPIVRDNRSQFAVTVERLEMIGGGERTAAEVGPSDETVF